MFLYMPLTISVEHLQRAYDGGHRSQRALQEYLDMMYPGQRHRLRREVIIRPVYDGTDRLVFKNNFTETPQTMSVGEALLRGTKTFFMNRNRRRSTSTRIACQVSPIRRTRHHLQSIPKECPVCYDKKSSLEALSCGHVFCTDCLTKWRQTSSTCPICRANVSS